MTTLGPDHFGHNIQMVIITEAAITAPENRGRKPQEVQIPSNSSFNRSYSVYFGSKTKYSTVTVQVTVKLSTVYNNVLKRGNYKCVARKNTVL